MYPRFREQLPGSWNRKRYTGSARRMLSRKIPRRMGDRGTSGRKQALASP